MSKRLIVYVRPCGRRESAILITPPKELESLRLQGIEDHDIYLEPHHEHVLQIDGTVLQLKLEMSGPLRSSMGVKIFALPYSIEETLILFDPRCSELVVVFSKSSVTGSVTYPSNVFSSPVAGFPGTVSEQRAPLYLTDGEALKLDIYLDRSVIEVFANGVQCVMQVVYPELEASSLIQLFSTAEATYVREIRSWAMSPTHS